ncbi:MAG: DUF4386 family protein [Anaerolineae bacterium]|nr:DUF4386 family protein [Anaerolineae bacterium]MCB0230478.1 DUF4386 family protein [Anaerolineae bacterium]MCB0239950.1 DUF4386 family protein [Anaerolineae bacterium]MCB9142173.1 DUF4386 family protein [Anaerolineales bacterium]MCB9449826.1 DUF4386 family protein [Anaerolineaceae bacterium]
MRKLQLQKWGGAAALYEALAYIIGIVGFIAVANMSEIADPVQKVTAVVENQTVLSVLHLIVYVVWGASLVVLTLALHERLRGNSSALARMATAFGLIWATLVIASGMIYNVGMETAVSLYAQNPEQAATVWLAIESVFNGLGGGVEVVGGIWVVLLSVAALRNGGLPRVFNYFGFLVGAAGLVTVVPALSEIGGMVFGLTQIVWFAWLGIVLLRVAEKETYVN